MPKNVFKGTDGNTFTKDNQPSGELKSKGKYKASMLRKICSNIVKGETKGIVEQLAVVLDIEVNKVDIETLMHLKQIEKAVKEGDTKAYNAVMDRLNGKPLQALEVKDTTDTKKKDTFDLFPKIDETKSK